jgi:hypothetical protein
MMVVNYELLQDTKRKGEQKRWGEEESRVEER